MFHPGRPGLGIFVCGVAPSYVAPVYIYTFPVLASFRAKQCRDIGVRKKYGVIGFRGVSLDYLVRNED